MLLDVRDVTKTFGGLVAVRDVDLAVDEREIHSVIGPNGAGKTTFFNCITGFLQPDGGEIVFDGRRIVGLRPDQIARIGIARTYQNIRLFRFLSAIDNVKIGMHSHLHYGLVHAIFHTGKYHRVERESEQRARELLKFVGLEGKEDVIANSLPYGDQRRLEIARALALQPQLLLLDEPTAGMNPYETDQMITLIRRLRDEQGMTIMLIEHDMSVVMNISDMVTVLDFGEKIAEGRPEEVQRNPQVIEAYLGRGAAAGIENLDGNARVADGDVVDAGPHA